MIAIIVSVLSFLILVIVTVILVNQNIDNESKRKADMRRVVDQVNATNTSAASVEDKQNAVLKDVNSSLASLKKTVTEVNDAAARKTDIQAAVKSTSGSFDTLQIGGSNSMIITSRDNGLHVSRSGASNANDRIVGFDTTNNSRRILMGTDLQILQSGQSNMYTPFDAVGDVFIMTASNNRRLMLQNGAGAGLVLNKNRVGIGMDPQYASLDVNSNMAILGEDLLMGASNPRRVLSALNNSITLNRGQGFSGGVNVEGDMNVSGALTAASWKAASKDASGLQLRNGNLGVGVDPGNAYRLDVGGDINIRNGGLNLSNSNMMSLSNATLTVNRQGASSVVINGRTVTMGGTNFVTSDNSTDVFYGNTMRFSAAPKTPQSWDMVVTETGVTARQLDSSNVNANNVYSRRSIYENNASKYWTTYHNNDNNFVFVPEQVSLPSSTGMDEGVVRFTAKGDVQAKGAGSFQGNVQADGNVTSGSDLLGQRLCVRDIGGGNTCLNRTHLEYIISQYNASMAGPVRSTV